MFPVPDVPAGVVTVTVAVVPGTRCQMPFVPLGAGRVKTIFVSLQLLIWTRGRVVGRTPAGALVGQGQVAGG